MILSCNNIQKSFEAKEILRNISFQLNDKEKAAIVGINGAGKSTLFRILTNEISNDGGNVQKSSECKIGYLSQNMELNTENTIMEEMLNVFQYLLDKENELRELESSMASMNNDDLDHLMKKYSNLQQWFEENRGYSYKSHIRGVLNGLGFSASEFDMNIYSLSGGQKTRVCLAKLLLQNPSLLLLDEPTNHLDINAVRWLEDYLKGYDGALIIISHDRYFLDKIITKVVEIKHGISKCYNGNYSFYAKQKEIDRDIDLKHYLNQQKEIKKQKEVIQKLKSFNREKSVKRARSREKMLEKIELLNKPQELNDTMNLTITPKNPSGNDVLSVKDLKKSFDNKLLFENVNFEIKREDKVALIGANGIGKTTLFRIILNTIDFDSGDVKYGSRVKIGYYDQEQQNLSPNKTLIEEISDTYPTMTIGEIRNVLAAFLFTGDDVFKTISTLSGGEKGRISLAKIMLSEANFLILDEPTNHLDIVSKEILENTINNYSGTVLYISHDRYFINKTADKIIELQKNGVQTYLGNYDNYVEKINQLKKKEQLKSTTDKIPKKPNDNFKANTAKNDWLKNKEEQAKIRKRNNMIQSLEDEIFNIESLIEDIDTQLCDEDIYTNATKLQELHYAKTEYEEKLESIYEQWEKLNE